MSARKPWDRLPDEPHVWWTRFDRFYRPQGPGRTMAEAYKVYYRERYGHISDRAQQGATEDWYKIADEWNWQERAEEWDIELHKEKIAEEKAATRSMTKRQIEAAEAIQTLAIDRIIKDGFRNAKEGVQGWKTAVDIERVARGQPDHLISIAEMDDDEITRVLAKELARARIHQTDKVDDEEGEGETPSDYMGSADLGDRDLDSSDE